MWISAGLQPQAAARTRAITGQTVGRTVAFVWDGTVISAPVVKGPMERKFTIFADFRFDPGLRAAAELAACLKSGPLPTLVVDTAAPRRLAGSPAWR